MNVPRDAADRMIVALDMPTVAEAETLVATLGPRIRFYKIGFQLVLAGGLGLARSLAGAGTRVFLDMKLLDIDNTVAKAVESAADLGVDMLTVHAYPRAMAAAVEAARGSNLRLLAVTVLTSMDDSDLREAGYPCTAGELVSRRAAQARDIGMAGIVCSPAEAAMVRGIVGPSMAVVTPGVRPAGAERGDQKRVMTPAEAIAAGASHLVVGRPVTAAADPGAAAEAVLGEIAAAGR